MEEPFPRWKTYIAALLIGAVGVVTLIRALRGEETDPEMIERAILEILAALGLAGLRAGVAKAQTG